MLINEVKETVQHLASKQNVGGYLPDTDYSDYATLAQISIINELYDLLDYNRNVMTLLSVVLKETTLNLTDGVVAKPSDYYKYVTSSVLYAEDGELIENDSDYVGRTERVSRLRSKIVTPTLDYPIVTELGDNIQVDPSNARFLKLTYVYNPVDPVWSDDGYVPPEFDPSTSTDFVLGDQFRDILVNKIAMYFGIEVRDQNLQNATVQNLVGNIK